MSSSATSYHLNAEEEPETEDYPKDPEFRKKFGPRGVIHSWLNADGTQKIEDTGPLTKKRVKQWTRKPRRRRWLGWAKSAEERQAVLPVWNSTRMHINTHLKPTSAGKNWPRHYADGGVVEHDAMVGQLLTKLKELGIEDNTIVIYTTDNGAESYSGLTAYHDVSRRKEYQLGGRLSRSLAVSAGPAPSSPAPSTTTSPASKTCCHVARGCRRAGGDGKIAQGRHSGRQRPTSVHLDGYDLGRRQR